MTYRFRVLGPFEIEVIEQGTERHIKPRAARKPMFAEAQKLVGSSLDITQARGLYVYGLHTRADYDWPYYVGKAADLTLYKRCLHLSDKPRVYNEILQEYVNAKPFMYLLPLLTPSGKIASGEKAKRLIGIAEEQLIGIALQANSYLWNVQHRSKYESFVIDGIHP